MGLRVNPVHPVCIEAAAEEKKSNKKKKRRTEIEPSFTQHPAGPASHNERLPKPRAKKLVSISKDSKRWWRPTPTAGDGPVPAIGADVDSENFTERRFRKLASSDFLTLKMEKRLVSNKHHRLTSASNMLLGEFWGI
ncbi:hypothetical protein Q8A73_004185 [Channa argus]|nr:hypothetical protein Q8A73_004185 [Channa argus]